MKPVAFVTPWFGAELIGGAEQQAFQVATRLAARGHRIEVLTTCSRSFQSDWSSNYHAPGASAEHGLTIHRFPLDERDAAAFDQVNAKLLALAPFELKVGVNPLSDEEARIFVRENIRSSALLAHLRACAEDYQAFIFIPYMFAPISEGLPLVAERAFLQPCLHDEPAAHLPAIEAIFHGARGLLFNSEGEQHLALKLYGAGIFRRSFIVGEGIEGTMLSTRHFPDAVPAELRGQSFILYLGRRDQTKNVELLVRAFARFKETHPRAPLKLVLAGPGESFYGNGVAGIFDLGLVDEATKAALLRDARALFQPSRNESYSRAIMEAWSNNRPVAANRDCLATAMAVEQARGGWLAATEDEWAALFSVVSSATGKELHELGARGRAYADEHAGWDQVIARYEDALGLNQAMPHKPVRQRHSKLREIHQLLPDIVYGDAISNHALAIRTYLREAGFASEIFVKRREARMKDEAQLFGGEPLSKDAGMIYHHSIGSDLTALAVAHAGAKCLVYHNITPAEFYTPYRPGFAWMLETGRAHLSHLARHFPISVGDSSFNAAELAACGFKNPGVLPIIVNPDTWNMRADESLMESLQDGLTNLLFVGRVAPNKRQDQLVEVFAHYRALERGSRLIIAGDGRFSDPFYTYLKARIAELSLGAQVLVTGRVSNAELLAYYRTAHLYLSLSEHEGFGVPLVEAMWFDVPVLARRGTAVTETLGDAGATFDPQDDLRRIATIANLLAHDAGRRAEIIAAQQLRRLDFMPEAVWPILERLIERMKTSTE